MEQYKQEFIEFMVDCQALKFGEFTLKSGRKSPFFMNAGAYVTGSQLMKLGESYAKAIHDTYGDDFDVLFGPAYKGIPISVVTAVAYSKLYGKEIRYCSDRKEEKDHAAAGAAVFSVLRRNQSIRAQSFRGNIRSYRIYPVGNRGDGRSGAWCAHLDPEASV